MAKEKRGDPPLRFAKELAYESGWLIVTHQARGFLIDQEFQAPRGQLFKRDARESLLALCGLLRKHLDSVELPTDKWPIMPIELDYGYNPSEHGYIPDEDLWFDCVKTSTEPLTKDRISAELLHTVNRVLATFNDDQLQDVFRVMKLFQLHCTVGELNELALTGQASKKAREKGPRAKSERAQHLRKMVLATAREYWSHHPKFKGQPFNTSKKITEAINKARRAQMPGCAPLSPKTIADHLRLALREDS